MDEDDTAPVILLGNREASSKNKQKKLHQCTICNEEFPSKVLLVNHKKQHRGDVHRCDICNRTYGTRKYLQRHKSNVHSDKQSKYKCGECGRGYPYPNKLREHERVHTGEKPHECDVCGKAFRVHYTLSIHLLSHTELRPYACAFCAYACRDTSTLRKHEARHMHSAPRYQCRRCRATYATLNGLRSHVSAAHAPAPARLPCRVCRRRYKNKATLQAHTRLVHERANAGTCDVCHAHIPNMHNYAAHLQTHSAARPYTCRHCALAFNTKGNLLKHSYIHRADSAEPGRARRDKRSRRDKRARRDKHARRDSSSAEVMMIKEEMLDIVEHELIPAPDLKLLLENAVSTEIDSKYELIEKTTDEDLKFNSNDAENTDEVKAECNTLEEEEVATEVVAIVATRSEQKSPLELTEDTFRRDFLRQVAPSPSPAQEDQPKHGFVDKSELEAQRRDIARALQRARQRGKLVSGAVERARRQYNARLHAIARGGDTDPSGNKRTLVTRRDEISERCSIDKVGNDTTKENDTNSDTEVTNTDAKLAKRDTEVTSTATEVRRSSRLRNKPKREYCTFDKFGDVSEDDDDSSTDDVLRTTSNTHASNKTRQNHSQLNLHLEEYLLPKLSSKSIPRNYCNDHDGYINSLSMLRSSAKKEGKAIVFPCDTCAFVCRALGTLKSHRTGKTCRRNQNIQHVKKLDGRPDSSRAEKQRKISTKYDDKIDCRKNSSRAKKQSNMSTKSDKKIDCRPNSSKAKTHSDMSTKYDEEIDCRPNSSRAKTHSDMSTKSDEKIDRRPNSSKAKTHSDMSTKSDEEIDCRPNSSKAKTHSDMSTKSDEKIDSRPNSSKAKTHSDMSTKSDEEIDSRPNSSKAKTPDNTMKEFFEKNLKGADIEFEQFAEAFNAECDSVAENVTKKVRGQSNKGRKLTNNKYVRVVRMTQSEYRRRLEVKNRLREKLAKGNESTC